MQEWQPGWPDHEILDGYIEEEQNDLFYSQDICYYMLHDVHYYVPEYKFKNTKPKDKFFLVGLEFHTVPGDYMLPFGEGDYRLDKDGYITMQSKRSGTYYYHRNSLINNVDLRLSLGWITFCATSGHPEDYSCTVLKGTGFYK